MAVQVQGNLEEGAVAVIWEINICEIPKNSDSVGKY